MWSKNFELLTRNTWRKDRKHRHMFGHWNSIGKILSATSWRKNILFPSVRTRFVTGFPMFWYMLCFAGYCWSVREGIWKLRYLKKHKPIAVSWRQHVLQGQAFKAGWTPVGLVKWSVLFVVFIGELVEGSVKFVCENHIFPGPSQNVKAILHKSQWSFISFQNFSRSGYNRIHQFPVFSIKPIINPLFLGLPIVFLRSTLQKPWFSWLSKRWNHTKPY